MAEPLQMSDSGVSEISLALTCLVSLPIGTEAFLRVSGAKDTSDFHDQGSMAALFGVLP